MIANQETIDGFLGMDGNGVFAGSANACHFVEFECGVTNMRVSCHAYSRERLEPGSQNSTMTKGVRMKEMSNAPTRRPWAGLRPFLPGIEPPERVFDLPAQ